MITLYHGSNISIDTVDLSFSRRGKDFGSGFYLNPDRQQAMEMASRTTQRMLEGKPIVTTFLFDDTLLNDNSPLNVKIFEEYSKEWAEFVLLNRKNSSDVPAHEYDVVVGPIANDTVGLQMRRFILGYISIERMIEELRFKKPAIQYFFGTELAVGYLKKI